MKKTYHEIDIEEMKRTADAVGYEWLLILRKSKDNVKCEYIEASRIDELPARYWEKLLKEYQVGDDEYESDFVEAILTNTLPKNEMKDMILEAGAMKRRLQESIDRQIARMKRIPNYTQILNRL